MELGLSNVSFIGKVAESDLPEFFNNADVYVSAAQTDGTSVTLLQAMSMKVPVVVSDSPGNISLLKATDNTQEANQVIDRGTLFQTNNATSLAHAILNIKSDQQVIDQQVNAAWEYVQTNANWNQNIERLLPLLGSR